MSLTPQDLHSIKEIVTANNEIVLAKVEMLIDAKLEHQTKDIAQVINTLLSSADSTFATKTQLAELEIKGGKIQRHLALDM